MRSEPKKGHHHRSALKQTNKPFKGGSSKTKSRGRVEVKKRAIATLNSNDLSRTDRKNKMAMIQQQKRRELTQQRRIYAGLDGMPRLIGIIPVSSNAAVEALPFPYTSVFFSESNRQNLRFISCSRAGHTKTSWIDSILNVAQLMDCICFVVSATDADFDEHGMQVLSLLRAIGMSSCTAILQGLSGSKNTHQVKTIWLGRFETNITRIAKIYCGDSLSNSEGGLISRERSEMERALCQQHLNGLLWRDLRPYMLTDTLEVSLLSTMDDSVCSLKATGFIRGGKPFSANKLVYIPAIGNSFIVSKIEEAPPVSGRRVNEKESSMEIDALTVQIRDEQLAESLETETGSDMDSHEHLQRIAESMLVGEEDTNNATKVPKKILVPKGTSSYQAAWLEGEKNDNIVLDDEEYEEINIAEMNVHNGDDCMDLEEHNTQFEKHRELQFSARHFPDEIDLDPSISARTRLQRYRGVQSLRTSNWDPNENLPHDYSRIFRFGNYKQSRKAAIEENDSPFKVGQRVNLYIENIPIEYAAKLTGHIVIFGLVKYEQKQAIINFAFSKSKTYNEPLFNKQEMVAVIGFRKFVINPILSEHTNLSLHKMLRTIEPTEHSMAVGTIFAPVTFTPCPILLFIRSPEDGSLVLAGTGSLLDVDPHRIILKRITLTGSPFRIHKRTAVIRFMFNSPTDVNWFKPVELVCKNGARGHIRESLGTHGYMKCLFDRGIFHHDTVAMHLYKRVFPKWTSRSITFVA